MHHRIYNLRFGSYWYLNLCRTLINELYLNVKSRKYKKNLKRYNINYKMQQYSENLMVTT